MSRRRPLLTCGVSFLAIIHTACRKAQELNGPLGKWAKWITKSISLILPLMYAVQYQWLAILSFTDDCILTFEKMVEIIFPPATLLFDKIDNLVYTAELMPGRFDEGLNRFLVIVQRVPFLEWALMQITWWLDGNHIEEKDILIDMNSNTRSNVTESVDNASSPSEETPYVYCTPKEKIFEVGKAESNAELLPALAKSEDGEKSVSVSDSMENEMKKDNNPTKIQSGDLSRTAAPPQRRKSVDNDQIQLQTVAPPIGRASSQDRRKSAGHVEFPSITDLWGTAKKEELHGNSVLVDDTSQDKTKSIGVKLKAETVKQTKAGNPKRESQQSGVLGRDKEKGTQKSIKNKDPVLELFESRWLL